MALSLQGSKLAIIGGQSDLHRYLSRTSSGFFHTVLHCIAQVYPGISEINKENAPKNCPLIPGEFQVDPATYVIHTFIPSKGTKRKLIPGGIARGKLFCSTSSCALMSENNSLHMQ